MTDIITTLYDGLTKDQRSYFDIHKQIGPFAAPTDQAMEWPNLSEIEREISDVWGSNSLPMAYFQAIFVPPNVPNKNYERTTVPHSATNGVERLLL